MKRLLCDKLPSPGQPVCLADDEANHATQVLRLNNGATVEALDGSGHAITAILRIKSKNTFIEYDPTHPLPRLPSPNEILPLTLELAVLKSDAMEWVIEKAVELGVETLVPIITTNTVVKINQKGPEIFCKRWRKIADQALKQCGRLKRLQILPPTSLQQTQIQRFWCDETAGNGVPYIMNQKLKLTPPISILIGPEGGWTEEERKYLLTLNTQGTNQVTLGPLILRAETAAVFAISVITASLRTSLTTAHR